jgi:hypothetical protein
MERLVKAERWTGPRGQLAPGILAPEASPLRVRIATPASSKDADLERFQPGFRRAEGVFADWDAG